MLFDEENYEDTINYIEWMMNVIDKINSYHNL